MKKLFLLLTLALINLAAFSQVTQYSAKQIVARDSLYLNGKWIKNIKIDTANINGLTRDAMSADAIYDFVNGRTLKYYQDLADTAAAIRATPGPPDCTNKLLTDWNVSWQGTGFNYTVHGGLSDGTGSYRIICDVYTADSATVTFSAADSEEDRIDIIYLDATGVHVREGALSAPGTAVRPTVDAEEILLTEVLVAAGATEPTLTQLIVYNENTESVVTNTGTTTNGANTTFVFRGTLSTNISNINHNDQVFFTKAPSLSTWDVLNFDALSLAIRLKANLPNNANIGIALQVGTTTVGTEVIVPLVRTNTTSYQQISVPLSAFGNIQNTAITRVRFRYIRPGNNANYSGFYLDYIYFVDQFQGPNGGGGGGGGTATFTLNPMVGFTSTPTATQQSPGTWTLTPTGYSSLDNFLSPDGWQNLPQILSAIGTLDGRAKTADGAEVDEEEIFLQTVDGTYPGLMTPAMFLKLDSNYYITNLDEYPNSDSLARPVTQNITGIKGLKDSTGIGFAVYDNYISIYATGVGGGGLLPTSGTGTATGAVTGELEGNNFLLRSAAASPGGIQIIMDNTGDGGDDVQYLEFTDNQNMKIGGSYLTGFSQILFDPTKITFDQGSGKYVFSSIQEFTDNADAISGGLTADMIYRTGDALKIVH